MAIPYNLALWQEFVAQSPQEPEVLSRKQLLALSPEAKEEYDLRRFAWIGSDTVIQTKDSDQIDRHLRIVQAGVAAKRATAKRGFALSGYAGVGKSTTALLIGKRHERRQRKVLGDGPDVTPVVYVVAPPGATPKLLMRAFARWVGLQIPARFDADQIADQVVSVLTKQRTSMVIVDEVHNLRTRSASGHEAASQLKQVSEKLDAAFLYCGIDLLDADIFTGEMGRQLRARTKIYPVEPYSIGSETGREEWLELVRGMEDLLPLSSHPEGSLDSEAHYLYHRTGGSIGSLRGLLGDAAIAAIFEGTERVDRALLDTIILDEEAVRAAKQAPPIPRAGTPRKKSAG